MSNSNTQTHLVSNDSVTGGWKKDPSGLKNGNLKLWRDCMHRACPNPTTGQIVVMNDEENGRKIGYRCITPDGYNTRWERVSKESFSEGSSHGYIEGQLVRITSETRPFIDETASGIPCTSQGVYLGDGVYIDPDECWF